MAAGPSHRPLQVLAPLSRFSDLVLGQEDFVIMAISADNLHGCSDLSNPHL
jgi:hypothetical protein